MSEIDKEPSIGISLSMELPGKRQLVLQSFVPRDCTSEELNAILDKIRVSGERQFAFGALEGLSAELGRAEKLARDHASRIQIVDENIQRRWQQGGRRGEVKLSQKEEQEQRQAYAHAEALKEQIAKLHSDIADYRAKIGA